MMSDLDLAAAEERKTTDHIEKHMIIWGSPVEWRIYLRNCYSAKINQVVMLDKLAGAYLRWVRRINSLR